MLEYCARSELHPRSGLGMLKRAADDSFRRFVRRLVNECRLYRPVGTDPFLDVNPGLKPRAESLSPFGTKSDNSLRAPNANPPNAERRP